MNINTSTLLNILNTGKNTVDKNTNAIIEKLSVDGKVNVETLIKNSSIQSLLSNLFKDVIDGVKTKNKINEILLNGKKSFNFKSLSKEIKTLVSLLKDIPELSKFTTFLKDFSINIKDLDKDILENNFKNSGIFLESNIAKSTNMKTLVSQDLKAILLQLLDISDNKDVKIQLEKIQTQIEFYQLLSYSSNTNHTYLPFSWEDLEDADIKFKANENDSFSCQINLLLKKMEC